MSLGRDLIAAMAQAREQDPAPTMRITTKRENEAIALLEEIREWLDGQIDVVDGDYGIPEPNRAMQLANAIDYLMGRREGP